MIAAGMSFHSVFRKILCLFSFSYFIHSVTGQVHLTFPPSRSSAQRFGFDSSQQADDDGAFCSESMTTHDTNKCGVCGDVWLPRPREHERGGKYYNGRVTTYFNPKSIITTEVRVIANNGGFLEFRICRYDKPENDDLELYNDGTMVEVTQTCLDRHLLYLADGQGTQFHLPNEKKIFKVDLKLPKYFMCRKCLFQVKYKTGINLGNDQSGKSCIGCGEQREYKACADVVIDLAHKETNTMFPIPQQMGPFDGQPNGHQPGTSEGEPVTKKTPQNKLTTDSQTIHTTPMNIPSEATGEECQPTLKYAKVPGITDWCNTHCKLGKCPATHCVCTKLKAPNKVNSGECQPTQNFAEVSGMTDWCNTHCKLGNCPATHCLCTKLRGPRKVTDDECQPTLTYADEPGMRDWCHKNCKLGHCPAAYCLCTKL